MVSNHSLPKGFGKPVLRCCVARGQHTIRVDTRFSRSLHRGACRRSLDIKGCDKLARSNYQTPKAPESCVEQTRTRPLYQKGHFLSKKGSWQSPLTVCTHRYVVCRTDILHSGSLLVDRHTIKASSGFGTSENTPHNNTSTSNSSQSVHLYPQSQCSEIYTLLLNGKPH